MTQGILFLEMQGWIAVGHFKLPKRESRVVLKNYIPINLWKFSCGNLRKIQFQSFQSQQKFDNCLSLDLHSQLDTEKDNICCDLPRLVLRSGLPDV